MRILNREGGFGFWLPRSRKVSCRPANTEQVMSVQPTSPTLPANV